MEGWAALGVLLAIAACVALLAHGREWLGRRRALASSGAAPGRGAVPASHASHDARMPAGRPLSWAAAGLILVAITALVAYRWSIGPVPSEAPSPVAKSPGSADAEPAARRALSTEQLQRMVDQVAARLQQEPNDAQAWAMLAHSYEMMGRYPESAKAFARLAELLPNDAQVLADYADVLAVTQGRSMAGEPIKLVRKALALDPQHLKALALAGTEAFERRSYAEAVSFWERARRVSTDPAFSRQLENDIAEANAARDDANAPAAGRTSVGTSESARPDRGGTVSGRVRLSAAMKARTAPDDTVFIFARPVQGSRVPVAIVRTRVGDLPLDYRLDDSSAMVADMPLSKLDRVVIVARVTKRGDATAQAGDLQATSAPIKVGSQGVNLEINEVVP